MIPNAKLARVAQRDSTDLVAEGRRKASAPHVRQVNTKQMLDLRSAASARAAPWAKSALVALATQEASAFLAPLAPTRLSRALGTQDVSNARLAVWANSAPDAGWMKRDRALHAQQENIRILLETGLLSALLAQRAQWVDFCLPVGDPMEAKKIAKFALQANTLTALAQRRLARTAKVALQGRRDWAAATQAKVHALLASQVRSNQTRACKGAQGAKVVPLAKLESVAEVARKVAALRAKWVRTKLAQVRMIQRAHNVKDVPRDFSGPNAVRRLKGSACPAASGFIKTLRVSTILRASALPRARQTSTKLLHLRRHQIDHARS